MNPKSRQIRSAPANLPRDKQDKIGPIAGP
uniref:Uncharacterized protein n=1 Tax=Arundo donax TaxID=35708 RepID=A0A0A9FE84_ARUDO